jgi:hypothetical protein
MRPAWALSPVLHLAPEVLTRLVCPGAAVTVKGFAALSLGIFLPQVSPATTGAGGQVAGASGWRWWQMPSGRAGADVLGSMARGLRR